MLSKNDKSLRLEFKEILAQVEAERKHKKYLATKRREKELREAK
jgi:hypothetical protein